MPDAASAATPDPYAKLDRDELLSVVRDLIAERDEVALGLPVGFYTGWFDSATAHFRYDYVSPRAADLLGVTVEELRADWRATLAHVHPDDRASLEYEATAVAEPGDEADWTGRIVINGVERWIQAHAREYESRPGRWLGVIADVTERKKLEVDLAQLANTDPLTGLGNRRLFEDQAQLLLADWARGAGPLALVLIDLDNFKEVNDSFGHHAGDEALRQVGRILRRHGRSADVIARMGGDEFAVLMPQTDCVAARAAAVRISAALDDGKATTAHLAPLGMSIGIAVLSAPQSGTTESPDSILRRADHELYEAKAAGRNTIRVCDGG